MLGAIERASDSQHGITALGRQLLRIPAHPRLARLMLAAAEQNLLQPAATIAALMSEKDILLTSTDLTQRRIRDTQGRSDLLHRLHLLEVAEQSHFARSLKDQGIDPSAARQVTRTRDDLLRQSRHLKTVGRTHSASEDDLLKLILLAYPDRLCHRRESNPDTATMVGGFGIRIDPASIVVQASLFIAIDARDDTRGKTREAISRILSEVEEPWLEDLFPHLISESREVDFDQATGRLTARIITRFADLPIRQRTDHHANPDDLAAALATLARQQAPAIFAADPAAAQVLQRTAFLRKHIPEKPWPAFDAAQLGEILAHSAPGKRSLQQLKEQDLAELLLSEMDYQQRRLLDDLAPTHLTVPSGSRIRLEYDGEKQPILAVRLQEVFSWLATPRIAGNRVPLLLHLLGPNYRPVQITSDLASFWKTTYFQVRKDLRIRYPKHSWPENPLTAKPEAKGRPRKT
jgi:ATP-dependent helicase HrpB